MNKKLTETIDDHLENYEKIGNLTLDTRKIDRLVAFRDTLLIWSASYNLIGPSAKTEIFSKHIYDSILFNPWIPPASQVADIGSGAGFPGVVLAILNEGIHFSLIEPLKKRCRFLQCVIAKLQLKNVVVVNKNAQEMPEEYHNTFDVTLSRGLGTIFLGAQLSWQILKRGGVYVTIKGENYQSDLADFEKNTTDLHFDAPQILWGDPNFPSKMISLRKQ